VPSPQSRADAPIPRADALAVLEAEAEQLVAEHRRAREARAGVPTSEGERERAARTLASLADTLRKLQALHSGTPISTGAFDHDDMPTDIDEFRNELAQRIRAFVQVRLDAGLLPGDGPELGCEVD
jgi:hypothetical protein